MKLKKYHVIIFTIFILYGINHTIFERKFFFNEILSLIGFVSLALDIKNIKNFGFFHKMQAFFILLCIIHLLLSWYKKTNLYYYLRNSVIFYSCFSAWIGYFWAKELIEFFRISRWFLLLILLFSYVLMLLTDIKPLDRYSVAVFIPLIFINKAFDYKHLAIIILMKVVYLILFPSFTMVIVIITISLLYFMPNFRLFAIFSIGGLSVLVAFFIYFSKYIERYKIHGDCCLYGNMHAVVTSHKIFTFDGNTTWRAILWYRAIVERSPENLWGIGFGTPLLPYREGMHVQYFHEMHKYAPIGSAEYEIHVSGVHNTYLTLFLRLGLLFVVFLGILYYKIFSFFYRFKEDLRKEGLIVLVFSFFAISIIGFFNLVLESPIYASLFWVLLGALLQIIQVYAKEN